MKHSTWFAAGPEVQRALLLLSDGAYRLYSYLCLNSNRKTGTISLSYSDIAIALKRSPRSIFTHFRELREQGVCHIYPAVNQHHCTKIEIADEFWPYTKGEAVIQASNRERYLAEIRELLSARACIKCAFTAADQEYGADLFNRGVTVDEIERAIALGCCRRYQSLLNRTVKDPIFSFLYFRDLIEEVRDPDLAPGYLSIIIPEVQRLEKKWLAKKIAPAEA